MRFDCGIVRLPLRLGNSVRHRYWTHGCENHYCLCYYPGENGWTHLFRSNFDYKDYYALMSRDYRCKWPGVFYLNVCSPCHFNSGQIKRTTYRLQIHLPFEFFAQFIRSIFNHVAHHTYTISLVSCDVLNRTTSALHNGISSLNASVMISLDVDGNSFAKSTRRKNTQDFSPLLHQNIWKKNCNSGGNQFLVFDIFGENTKDQYNKTPAVVTIYGNSRLSSVQRW